MSKIAQELAAELTVALIARASVGGDIASTAPQVAEAYTAIFKAVKASFQRVDVRPDSEI